MRTSLRGRLRNAPTRPPATPTKPPPKTPPAHKKRPQIYCGLHYGVASQTAHVTALFPPFLGVMLEAGIDGRLAALSLAYVTNLIGGLTHYASAQVGG